MVHAPLHGVLRHLEGLHDGRALAEAADAQLLERFARGHEEAAFAALVRRHGPMVWGVSRRVLPHVHDAEDVFQATFLLLARKAGSIRKAESVGSFLHGVAHRLALKLRVQQARRRSREKRSADMRTRKPDDDPSLSEVRAALDTALGTLPEKYRAALVLCYLEGKTQEEAARYLGCPLPTLRTRVARGRKLLRDRLANRGLALSTAGLAALLIASAAPAAVPAALARAAVRAAVPFAAGQPAAALCSAQAAGLVEGGLRAMFLTRVKTATVVLLAAGLVAGTAALMQRGTAADDPGKPAAAAKVQPAADDQGTLAYGGRVLGPHGRPVAGAHLHLTLAWGYPHRPAPSPRYATTGPDGRFAFTVPKVKFGDSATVVAAAAANYGVGWVKVPAGGKRDDLTIRLVDDDVPIAGQIVDLEAKPVPGATLTVMQINAAPGEDLGPWLEAVKARKGVRLDLEQQYVKRYTIAVPLRATTDAEGRFRLTGVGRNRLVAAMLDGPTITSQPLHIVTRPGPAIEVPEDRERPEPRKRHRVTTYYGASFRHVAAPTRPIVGVVRDQDTRKPLAGVTVGSYSRALGPSAFEIVDLVRTTTDARGRYRLVGMPKADGWHVVAIPGRDQPYVATSKEVPDHPGLDAVTVDVELKRGVWIEGKLTDKVTGKPVPGAVEYFALYTNPNRDDYPGFDGTFVRDERIVPAKADGSYRVAGLPGPGLVGVYCRRGPYLRADERDDEFGTTKRSLQTAPYHISFTSNYNALAPVDPPGGVEAVKRDVTLDPGWAFTVKVHGPDGRPLAGARTYDLNGELRWEYERMPTAEFTGRFNPRRPSEVFFLHPEKGLVGVALPPKEKGDSVTVRLGLAAAVRGRLVDAAGQPRPGVGLEVELHPKGWEGWFDYSPEPVRTDGDGRFHVEGLLPGRAFRLSDGMGVLHLGGALRPGQTKDLGDVRLKGEQERATDRDKMQGAWRLESLQEDDKPAPDEKGIAEVIIKEDKLVLKYARMNYEAVNTFTLDESKEPRWVNITAPGLKAPLPGIYRLDGDTLKMCWSTQPGGKRPDAFATSEGSFRRLAVLKRKK